jgi:CDP-diacylglycerol--serine O-phosphatidyltransferase
MVTNKREGRAGKKRGLTFNRLVPNAITVAAACAGMTSIRFAIDGMWEFAAGAILIAAILDTLDGRMARLLNASTDFGAELDSLSDFIAFGVAPGFIMYFWALDQLGGIGWAVSLFYAISCGLRLARFNSSLDKLPSYAYNYFQGVPAPAGAGIALLPMLLFFVFDLNIAEYPVFVAVWLIFTGLMMVGSFATFSFKKWKVPSRFMLPVLAFVALTVASLIGQPWITMSVVLIAYLSSIPFAVVSYRKLEEGAAKIKKGGRGSDDDKPDDTKSDGEPPSVHLRSV